MSVVCCALIFAALAQLQLYVAFTLLPVLHFAEAAGETS